MRAGWVGAGLAAFAMTGCDFGHPREIVISDDEECPQVLRILGGGLMSVNGEPVVIDDLPAFMREQRELRKWGICPGSSEGGP